jgi:hypothetical protein
MRNPEERIMGLRKNNEDLNEMDDEGRNRDWESLTTCRRLLFRCFLNFEGKLMRSNLDQLLYLTHLASLSLFLV